MPTVPYPPDRSGRVLKDGRPLPDRPATRADHHDHRHFPFKEADCRICEDIDKRERLVVSQVEPPRPPLSEPLSDFEKNHACPEKSRQNGAT